MLEAVINGRPLRLMLDTGATHTALTTQRLRVLGAKRLARQARVMTAGGLIETGVYEVDQLAVAGRVFAPIEVLALDDLPDGVDGLLGMDVLEGMQWTGPGG